MHQKNLVRIICLVVISSFGSVTEVFSGTPEKPSKSELRAQIEEVRKKNKVVINRAENRLAEEKTTRIHKRKSEPKSPNELARVSTVQSEHMKKFDEHMESINYHGERLIQRDNIEKNMNSVVRAVTVKKAVNQFKKLLRNKNPD